jgi:hypothetical protein
VGSLRDLWFAEEDYSLVIVLRVEADVWNTSVCEIGGAKRVRTFDIGDGCLVTGEGFKPPPVVMVRQMSAQAMSPYAGDRSACLGEEKLGSVVVGAVAAYMRSCRTRSTWFRINALVVEKLSNVNFFSRLSKSCCGEDEL